MKKALLMCHLLLMILTGGSLDGRAQESLSPQLSNVAQVIEEAAKESLPEWKLERVEPMRESRDVLIEFAVSCGRRVKLSIMQFPSAAEASRAIQEMAGSNVEKAALSGIGDEAFRWGYSDDIAFRKDTLAVFVSAVSDIDRVVPSLDQADLKRNEEVALNKGFARTIAAILSAPPSRAQRDVYSAPPRKNKYQGSPCIRNAEP